MTTPHRTIACSVVGFLLAVAVIRPIPAATQEVGVPQRMAALEAQIAALEGRGSFVIVARLESPLRARSSRGEALDRTPPL